jgi:xylan 1,4-beta-xylosidase
MGFSHVRLVGLFALHLCVFATAAYAGPGEDYAALTVDAGGEIGTLKTLRGVSGAPDLSFVGAKPLLDGHRPADISASYREAGVNLVRTHDSEGAGDIDNSQGPLPPIEGPGMGERGDSRFVIFPNLAADPANPASYNFGPTDKLIAGIRAIDADVLFRLGRGGGTTAAAPQDLVKYGEIIRHIVLHYNQGWAGGSQNSVKYWEVWNEPDLGKIWWRGTPQEYYRLYGAAAHAVKSADPNAKVGGPTIALIYQKQPYREGFLAYVRQNKLPFDFFSWHYYSDANDPYDFARLGVDMRRLLDQYGFKKTANSLDEWNSNEPQMMRAVDAQQAAFVASARIYMEDAPIDQDAYYRADGDFGADGRTANKVGQALTVLSRMAHTPRRLKVTGADTKGLAVEAGRSADGNTVQVLISNYEIPAQQRMPREGANLFKVPGLFEMSLPPRRSVKYDHNRGYDLSIRGLSSGSYIVEHYRISDAEDLALRERVRSAGPVLHINAALAPPAVELLVIHREP